MPWRKPRRSSPVSRTVSPVTTSKVEITLDDGPPEKPLNVYMVRGLIAQTLENLLTNSVYWLQQGSKMVMKGGAS